MGRLDNRTIEQFKSHIEFTTAIEGKLMEAWSSSSNSGCEWYIDNGIDNGGGYIPDGVDTSDVDFIAKINGLEVPLEMKFVPTAGKFTLKTNDMRNYIKKNATVLLIFNLSERSLKVPADLDIKKHWKRIGDTWKSGELKWALVGPVTLQEMYENEEHHHIPYMGNKMGIVVGKNNYSKYFRLRSFKYAG